MLDDRSIDCGVAITRQPGRFLAARSRSVAAPRARVPRRDDAETSPGFGRVVIASRAEIRQRSAPARCSDVSTASAAAVRFAAATSPSTSSVSTSDAQVRADEHRDLLLRVAGTTAGTFDPLSPRLFGYCLRRRERLLKLASLGGSTAALPLKRDQRLARRRERRRRGSLLRFDFADAIGRLACAARPACSASTSRRPCPQYARRGDSTASPPQWARRPCRGQAPSCVARRLAGALDTTTIAAVVAAVGTVTTLVYFVRNNRPGPVRLAVGGCRRGQRQRRAPQTSTR